MPLSFYAAALVHERPYVEGYEDAVRYLSEQPDSDRVYYQGILNGDFIFHVRRFDPEKRKMVIRGKQIEMHPAFQGSPGRSVLRTPEKVREMFTQLGVRYVLIEENVFVRTPAVTREAMQSDKFELVKRIPLRSNDTRFARMSISIYRVVEPGPASVQTIRIPMLTLPNELELSLGRLSGQPWPPNR